MAGVLRPGQELTINWRGASGVMLQNLQRLKLDVKSNGGFDVTCYLTFIDGAGASVYIKRGHGLGGDLHVFVPAFIFKGYFSAGQGMVPGYAANKHVTLKFPEQVR
ncbi:MAG: hypothetical protein R3D83_04035 [Caenibius sp.]